MIAGAPLYSFVEPGFITGLTKQSLVFQLLDLLLIEVRILELGVSTSAFIGTDKLLLALVEVEAVVNALPLFKTWGVGNDVHVEDVIVGLFACAK